MIQSLVHTMDLIDLDQHDGWLRLVNVCAAHPVNVVIINTAARSNVAVRQYGELLEECLGELGKMLALWVINRQRDSVELLKEFMEVLPSAELHVVRNASTRSKILSRDAALALLAAPHSGHRLFRYSCAPATRATSSRPATAHLRSR